MGDIEVLATPHNTLTNELRAHIRKLNKELLQDEEDVRLEREKNKAKEEGLKQTEKDSRKQNVTRSRTLLDKLQQLTDTTAVNTQP